MDHDEPPSLIINHDNFTLANPSDTSPLEDNTGFATLETNNNMNDLIAKNGMSEKSHGHSEAEKSLKTLSNVKGRKREHSREKPYTCIWLGCEKSFSSSYSLKSHYRVHTGEKPYLCTHCTKAFKTAGDLQKHTRTHTGEKPFKCPFEGCGKKFTTSHICKVHIRTHTGERPYKCPFPDCVKAFSTATNYKNHVRIHTGEKPYACEVENCGKRFTEYSSFYKHQTVHSERLSYTCPTCGQVYKHATTLAAHQKTAHGSVNKDNEILQQYLMKRPQGILKVGNSSNLPSTSKTTIRQDVNSCNNAGFSRNVFVLPMNGDNQRPDDEQTISQTTTIETQQPQQLALVTTSSGLRLAFISQDGPNQHLTLAEVNNQPGILNPNNEQQRKSNAPTDQVVYVTTPEVSKEVKGVDNNLLEISTQPTAQATVIDETPINTDIWLHQPNNDNDKSTTELQNDQRLHEKEDFDRNEKGETDGDQSGLVLEISEMNDTQISDPVAFFEIGGSKYQLKIVNDESKDEYNELTIDETAKSLNSQTTCHLTEPQTLTINNSNHQLSSCHINTSSSTLPQTVIVTLQDSSET